MQPLSKTEIDTFVAEGFVRLDSAFLAENARSAAALFSAAGVDPDDPGNPR